MHAISYSSFPASASGSAAEAGEGAGMQVECLDD